MNTANENRNQQIDVGIMIFKKEKYMYRETRKENINQNNINTFRKIESDKVKVSGLDFLIARENNELNVNC